LLLLLFFAFAVAVALAFAVALLFVIPEGNLLFAFAFDTRRLTACAQT
jgi:hypothetical protein